MSTSALGAPTFHPNVKHMPDDGGPANLSPLVAPEPELQYKTLVDHPARLSGF